MADDEAIVRIANSWRGVRDDFVARNKVSETFAATPGVSQREFIEAHEAHGLRLYQALPTMDPETFEAFRELIGVIPALLQRRRDRG